MNSIRWVTLLWFTIIDIAAAGVFAYVWSPTERVLWFLVALAAVWILPFVVGIWTYLKYWLAYHVVSKRQIVRHIKADFHKNEFPAGLGFFDPDHYLRSLLEDENLPLSTRYRAAYLLGEKAASRLAHPMTDGMAIHLAYCHALEEYRPHQSAPTDAFFKV